MSTNVHLLMLASGKSYHATRWANGLSEAGVRVTFATIHKLVRPLRDDVEVIELAGLGKLSYLLTFKKLRKLIKETCPDLVHSHSAGGYALMGRLCGARPWIISVYGTDVYAVPNYSPIHKIVVGNLLRNADQLLSTSHAMADQVQHVFPSLARPIVTPFGVDTRLFSPRQSARKHDGVIKIGIVKKLEKQYGIDILIKAFNILAKDYGRKVELHIVGEGSERTGLKAMRESSDWAEQIFFHPPVPNTNVPNFLQDFDVFVVPSREESFGVAAVEASAVGLPVVASDVGGLPEVVDHGSTGLLVPPEDPVALAEAIARFIQDPESRVQFGLAGRKKVEQSYDWRESVSQMIDIYENVLAKAGDKNW